MGEWNEPKEYKEPKVIHYTHGFSYPSKFPHLILISFINLVIKNHSSIIQFLFGLINLVNFNP